MKSEPKTKSIQKTTKSGKSIQSNTQSTQKGFCKLRGYINLNNQRHKIRFIMPYPSKGQKLFWVGPKHFEHGSKSKIQ